MFPGTNYKPAVGSGIHTMKEKKYQENRFFINLPKVKLNKLVFRYLRYSDLFEGFDLFYIG